jgi:hypothetical protein
VSCLVMKSLWKLLRVAGLSTSRGHGKKEAKIQGIANHYKASNAAASLEEGHDSSEDEKHKGSKKSKKKLSLLEHTKHMWHKYGMIGVSGYVLLWASTFTPIYLTLHYDLMNTASLGMDPATIIMNVWLYSDVYRS